MLIVLDLETQKSFSEVEKADPKKLKVAFVGTLVIDDRKEEYLGFWGKELDQLFPLLEKASLVVGFNLKGFDYPVLSAYYPGDLNLLPTLDILEEFERLAGHRISLNSIARATLNIEKNGSGMQAINLYEQGKLDELKKYCFKDVRITYKIYQHGKKFGFLKYINRWNNIKTIKVNFKKEKEAKVQMTLAS